MVEDSVENFMTQFKPYAVEVELTAHTEGSPLIECLLQNKVLHFFERTGPYLSTAGKKNIILNGSAKTLKEASRAAKQFESTGLSELKGVGLVLEHQGRHLILDVGFTLVLSSDKDEFEVALGDWVEFELYKPIHGFILETPVKRERYSEEDSI